MTKTTTTPDDHTLVLTRELAAPPALVFEAWTSAAHLEKWFGPDGFTTHAVSDFRVGGEISIRLVGYGFDSTVRGRYREIVRPAKIVYTFEFDDVPGVEVEQRVTIEAHGAGARLTVVQQFPPWEQLGEAHAALLKQRWGGAPIGWNQTLDHLEAFVAKR